MAVLPQTNQNIAKLNPIPYQMFFFFKFRPKYFQCFSTFVFNRWTFLNASISLFIGVRACARAPGLVVGSGSGLVSSPDWNVDTLVV